MPQENLKKVVIDGIEWKRESYGVSTNVKSEDSYRSFTHCELAELVICSGFVEFLDALGYQLGKKKIQGL